MSDRIASIINEYREKKIEGKCIDLVPFKLDDAANVLKIRNKERNRYFLNQSCELNLEKQTEWYNTYLARDNEIYWCIYNKSNEFVGTIRIYDIDDEKDLCDQGSFIIDEEYAEGAPYAIEAELLTLDFAFEKLKMWNVINEDRADNKIMNNLTRKLGFEFIKDFMIDGIAYKYYLLNPAEYKKNRDKFQTVIDYWVNR